jgi:hypothetical protein
MASPACSGIAKIPPPGRNNELEHDARPRVNSALPTLWTQIAQPLLKDGVIVDWRAALECFVSRVRDPSYNNLCENDAQVLPYGKTCAVLFWCASEWLVESRLG